jgi:methionine--tRNA ligase beta chain
MNESKSTIDFEDFSKIDIRIGTVVSAEELEGSEKLIKMKVDFGEMGDRQILAGIKAWCKPENLEGRQFPFIVNIETRKMMGFESQGMIMAVDSDDRVTLLLPEESVSNGAFVK